MDLSVGGSAEGVGRTQGKCVPNMKDSVTEDWVPGKAEGRTW